MTFPSIVLSTGLSRKLVRQFLHGEREDVFRIRDSSLTPWLPRLDACRCLDLAVLVSRTGQTLKTFFCLIVATAIVFDASPHIPIPLWAVTGISGACAFMAMLDATVANLVLDAIRLKVSANGIRIVWPKAKLLRMVNAGTR